MLSAPVFDADSTSSAAAAAVPGHDAIQTSPAITTVEASGFFITDDSDSFSLTASNLHLAGIDPNATSLGKLAYGLAEIFVESQIDVSGLAGQARTNALSDFASVNTAAKIHEGMVAIDAIASDGDGAALLKQLEALGLVAGASYGGLAGGYIPIDQLDAVAALDTLNFARPTYVHHNVGVVTEQPVNSMNVDVAQATYGLSNLNGSGITVGLLSDSFNTATKTLANTTLTIHYAQDIASGDLPGDVTVLQDFVGGYDEGRAMAQAVYDIAPGAHLAFATADVSMAGFASNIVALAGISDIVVDDVFYYAEPFFQDGVIAQAVDTATSMGALYFSSAGNQAAQSYESAFRDSGQTIAITGANAGTYRLMDFDAGAGVDVIQSVTKSGTVTIALNWDQPSASTGGAGSASDLVLILYRANGTVLGSVNANNIGGDAIEIAQTASAFAGIGIGVRVGNADPGAIKYVTFGNLTVNEYATNSGTATGHANAATAISVGASDWVDSSRYGDFPVGSTPFPYAETFTSKGGVPIYFDAAGNRLAAPEFRSTVDLTASDGGNNSFFGSDVDYDADAFPNFYGTSQAAPNAAALAALLKQYYPEATNAQIEAALKASAIDITIDYANHPTGVGPDVTTGTGLIQADAAVQALQVIFGQRPTGTDAIIAIDEDAGHSFSPGDFGFIDADAGNSLASVRIATLPTSGTLTLGGTAIAAGVVILAADIGTLVFTPAANANGAVYASFTFQVSDGTLEDLTPNTITINVNSVDDPGVANDDAFTTDEATAVTGGNLFFDNGSGVDSDIDSPTLLVQSVNGSAAAVGSLIALASGASLQVNADGTFAYDPDHAFDSLTGVTGATNSGASDSFQYTLVGGGTATATIAVSGVGNNAAYGTAGADTLTGTGLDDVIYGKGGADSIDGGVGNDRIYIAGDPAFIDGGIGTDALYVLSGTLTLDATTVAGIENYYVYGGASLDLSGITSGVLSIRSRSQTGSATTIHGTTANDVILGGTGADTLDGGDGDDKISVYAAPASVAGGTGIDVLYVRGGATATLTDTNTTSIERIYVNDGGTIDISASTATFAVLRSLSLATGGATILGTAHADSLVGGLGADTLSGGGGDDRISLLAQPAHVDGGAGANDILILGADCVFDDTSLAGVERTILRGGVSADLSAVSGGMVISVSGAAGETAEVTGTLGTNRIAGGASDDIIDGGGGADVLSGGAGADRFVFSTLSDTQGIAGATDRILDFNHAQNDKIDLSALDADSALVGQQGFTFVGSAAFSGGSGYEARIEIGRNGNSYIQFDTTHDGKADYSILVHSDVPLSVTEGIDLVF